MFLGIQKPIVLGVRPSNYGVITYYFVGFGVTGWKYIGDHWRVEGLGLRVWGLGLTVWA